MARARRARRRLSLTSLIDVIFLLLLFFMLSSTFSTFAEIELTAAGSGSASSEVAPLFLQLSETDVTLNGEVTALASLPDTLRASPASVDVQPVLVSLQGAVTSQRLTDLLVILRAVPGLGVTILGAG